jgi:hypothetical protein
MRDSQFKEAEAEFQSALVRVGPYYPNLAAACHREIGFCVALGSRGRTFTVSEIQSLWDQANEIANKGEQSAIWASCKRPSETHSYFRTLLEKLVKEKTSPSSVIACLGSSADAREMLPIRQIAVNGRKCACCDLAFVKGMSQCSRCKEPTYVVCGVACQRKDWPRHKAACVPIALAKKD